MPDLPSDGTRVAGIAYPSEEYERKAEIVIGELETRPSPFGDPPQCWVDGKQVDPATVRPVDAVPEGE